MKVDLLIVGSGVAAAAIAHRLLASTPQASVLILEAGGVVKMQDYATWTSYMLTMADSNPVLPYTQYYDRPYPTRDKRGENLSVGGTEVPLDGARAMTYGGTTIHWGGWAFRLKPEDFFLHTNTGESIDWPFDYQTLEPYYDAAESYIGVSGDACDSSVPRKGPFPFPAFPFTLEDEPVAEAMTALGIDYGHLPIARRGITKTKSRHAPCQTTGTCKYCPFGARYAATNYLNDMREWHDYPGFKIRTNVVVESIVMGSPTRAAGVVCHDKTSRLTETIEAKRIVVAAGAIESAKLLLRSTSDGWPAGLGNQHDLVGRNFITHPYFIFDANLPKNPRRLQPEMNFPTLCSRHFDSPEEQAKGKFILVNPPSSPAVGLAQQMKNGMTRENIEQYVSGETQVQIHGMMEIFSRPENRVTNFRRINSLGMKETVVDYTKDGGFDARIQEIASHVHGIFQKMGAEPVGKPTISWRADHAACVARMSRDEREGVVDPDLRVHGTDNVYVCSNAVFPNTGTVNPTLTLAALSIRLGEHLAHGEF